MSGSFNFFKIESSVQPLFMFLLRTHINTGLTGLKCGRFSKKRNLKKTSVSIEVYRDKVTRYDNLVLNWTYDLLFNLYT